VVVVVGKVSGGVGAAVVGAKKRTRGRATLGVARVVALAADDAHDGARWQLAASAPRTPLSGNAPKAAMLTSRAVSNHHTMPRRSTVGVRCIWPASHLGRQAQGARTFFAKRLSRPPILDGSTSRRI